MKDLEETGVSGGVNSMICVGQTGRLSNIYDDSHQLLYCMIVWYSP